MNRYRFGTVLVMALLWLAPAGPAAADHPVYELPSSADWDHGDLSVLIVPPAHGQIFNFETSVLNDGDPNELTPFNSYLEAIEAAIAHWDEAIDVLGADWLKEYYEPSVYVLGRDDVPQDVLSSPDILVYTEENHGPSLGSAAWFRTGHARTPCVVRMSSSYFVSFTYADMFNVTAQEFGHCLSLDHVGSQGGVDPLSDLKHPEHDVMNGFYAHEPGEAGTHLHCVSNLDVLALEHVFDYKMEYSAVLNSGVPGITYMPAAAYGDTCELPPDNWRELAPPTALPGAAPMNSAIADPIDGTKVASSKFKKVTGTAFVDQSVETIRYDVEIALALIIGDGSCNWWNPKSRQFVSRDCYSPTWKALGYASPDRWSWKVPKDLPPGSYRVVSRVVNEYGNEAIEDDNRVDFTLTSR